MRPKIGMFISGNLAAMSMLPVYRAVSDCPELRVDAFTDGCALCDLPFPSEIRELSLKEMEAAIGASDLFVTSIRSPGKIERHFLRVAREAAVPSVLILADIGSGGRKLWDNLGAALPDTLLVADRLTHRHLVEAGIPATIIRPAGSPYLDSVLSWIDSPVTGRKQNEIGFFALPNDLDFATFPSSELYTEEEVLSLLAETAARRKRETIWARPHPKQKPGFDLGTFASDYLKTQPAVSLESFVGNCSAFISTYSTALLISAVAGRPSLSLQPTPHPIRAGLYQAVGIPMARTLSEIHTFLDERPVPAARQFINDHLYNPGDSTREILKILLELTTDFDPRKAG